MTIYCNKMGTIYNIKINYKNITVMKSLANVLLVTPS